MANLDANHVHDSLRRAAKAGISVFGANGHDFALHKPLPVSEVELFESRHSIRLPADYFHFITQVANGGAGPDYGLFPLGYLDDGAELKTWTEGDGFVGILSQPFQFDEPWNDLTGRPEFDPEEDEEKYDEQMNAFEERYWSGSLMNGAIPICHRGCALRLWLVVTGNQAGHVWLDGRADYTGLSPQLTKSGARATFSSWYSEWLEEVLAKC